MAALRKLTDSELLVVLEYKKKGMSNRRIARIFGVSEGAIRYWLKKIDRE